MAAEIWENGRSTVHRRNLLKIVSSNCSWDGTSLALDFVEPLDSLALLAAQGEAAEPALARLTEGVQEVVDQLLRRSNSEAEWVVQDVTEWACVPWSDLSELLASVERLFSVTEADASQPA